MPEIIVRIRPIEVMEDLELDLIRERARQLADWRVEVQDTRLFDAPYISVIANIPVINTKVLNRLKATFTSLPHMRALIWQRTGVEVQLEKAKLTDLKQAAG